MKKYYFLFFFFCFVFQAVSQNDLISIDLWYLNAQGKLSPNNKSLFYYDENGNEVLINNLRWNQDSISFIPSYRILKSYNEYNLITNFRHERFRDHINGYSLKEKFEYSYDGDCLRSIYKYKGPLVSSPREYFFYNPNTCLIDSIETHEYNIDGFGFAKSYVDKYYYSDNIESRIRFCRDSLKNFTVECGTSIYTKNDQGLIIKIEGDSDIGPEKYLKEYDDKGNLIFESYYLEVPPGVWDLVEEKNITYQYNEAELLKEKQMVSTSYLAGTISSFSTATETYEYNCEDLLKTKTSIDASGNTKVEFYQYSTDHNCDLPEDKDLMTIRPNFTQGHVLIESEILQTENSYIFIYDMNGRLLKQIKAVSVNNYHLDLSSFPNGNYLIQVFNKNYSETERVLKM